MGPTEGTISQGQPDATGVTSHIPEALGEVTETIKVQAAAVGEEATMQVRRLIDDATGQLRRKAEDQLGVASQALAQLGQQLGALAEGHPEDAGELSEM